MKIAVVSDTHGNLQTTLKAVQKMKEHTLEAVLHCGDICCTEIIKMFAQWPTHFVGGNCDDFFVMEHAIRSANQTWHGLAGDITIGTRTIGLLHGHESGRLERFLASGYHDLICYGHTHRYEVYQEGASTVLNPGALHRADPHTFALVDLKTLDVEFVDIDS